MSTGVRIAGFLTVLVVAFIAAFGIGNAVGPWSEPPAAVGHDDGHGESGPHGEPATASAADTEMPRGLMAAQDGYALRLADGTADAGRAVPVAFTIEGPDGRPVTGYEVDHEKRLHLIAVRRDYSGFQHVHPELGADGGWSARLDLTPGSWRLFADFTATGGPALTLGTDLQVAGEYRPAGPTGEVRNARVGGYRISLDGALTAGSDSKLTLRVTKDGRPVTDLQPYLGAYGHLVALREGDMAYLHVHPEGSPGDGTTAPGPEIVFYAAVPSSGSYRLFLDFRHDDVVHTAPFTVATDAAAAEPINDDPEPAAGGTDGHADSHADSHSDNH